MRISVLEQIPLFEGGSSYQVLHDVVHLARGVEEAGFHRLWLAEHHSTGVFQSSAPDLLMMHVLDGTRRIRVGSGGVMAMHYGSLQMAERFATLAALHPGRVDMGLGRAPGGDMRTAGALNQGRVIDPDSINLLVEETVALLRDELPADHHYASVTVDPRPDQLPEVWLLGSSGQSAAWAGSRDLNYAYAQFFTGRQQVEVMDHYRAHLPAGHRSGQTLSALCVSAAPTRHEAWEQALVAADARYALRTGRPARFRDPSTLETSYRAKVEAHLERDAAVIVGTYDEVASRVRAFAESHHTEEVMLISYIKDVETKIHQYTELAARLA
ncbi:MsnO8 family LLM class oxidoreductase [Actinomyces sp. 2119]|uniref:MsnO8 family LLM class oxidoreductase n=1 Tax=Actinomyces lilanjuaniae TaxID=2321394 RepID=A0ABM6Z5X8_9ACTO|nr:MULTISPECIES: MsnO8 family LLM class oxidoreductase [Actinomyces]AYD90557.1 MsnO8 family LLM class oxidoreductase [Actinomyces lilanjuaniae]RJF43991.1 MsnO8 family LLM class oxidoreductase [Actinomyces sp. 2119]